MSRKTAAQTGDERRQTAFKRSSRLTGYTDSVELLALASGTRHTMLVTVNSTPNGAPVEIVITAGRAGDEQHADADALGKIVTLALQHGVPPEKIAGTLRGINGGQLGEYDGRAVLSKADLIASALGTATKQRVERRQGSAASTALNGNAHAKR